MPKFKVTISERIHECREYEFEAENPKEAARQAQVG